MAEEEALEPLDITCTSTDCDNDLHCFRRKARRQRNEAVKIGGPCQECGADLVTWDRVNARNLNDVQYTFDSLKKELIRHEFWHRNIDLKAKNHAKRKGRIALRSHVEKRIRSSVGKARHPREGRQTPFNGQVVYYAQHAVAACCRKCIEYWHGIEPDRPLCKQEVEYLVELIMLYVNERLPDLPNEPQRVPPIRKQANTSKR